VIAIIAAIVIYRYKKKKNGAERLEQDDEDMELPE